jgi:hypothetical protein
MAANSGKKKAKVYYSVGPAVDKQVRVMGEFRGKQYRRGAVTPQV